MYFYDFVDFAFGHNVYSNSSLSSYDWQHENYLFVSVKREKLSRLKFIWKLKKSQSVASNRTTAKILLFKITAFSEKDTFHCFLKYSVLLFIVHMLSLFFRNASPAINAEFTIPHWINFYWYTDWALKYYKLHDSNTYMWQK